MTYEEHVVAINSTPGLKRTELTRATKKLMMEFDAQYTGMSREERDEFLDRMFPVVSQSVEENDRTKSEIGQTG